MKTYKLKDIFKALSASDSLLFDSYLSTYYPSITGSTVNFLTDYSTGHVYYDAAFAHKYGERSIDLEASTLSDAITEIRGLFSGVTLLNIQNWARLYYAFSLEYNPLYNVDGTTTFEHGATKETREYGEDVNHLEYAEAVEDIEYGSHIDTTTNYGVAMNSQLEKEVSKSSDDNATHTDTTTSYEHEDKTTRDERTDTISTDRYVDTETRQGNIGITKSTDLLDSEIALRAKNGFWEIIFKTLANEGGLYYDC